MIAQQPAHSMLVRSSMRSALASSSHRQIIARQPLVARTTGRDVDVSTSASRGVTTSASLRQAAVSDAPISTPQPKQKVSPFKAKPASASSNATNGRRRRFATTTLAERARQLLRWFWLERDSKERAELVRVVKTGKLNEKTVPAWFESVYSQAKAYRSARARLWTPTIEQASAFAGADVESVEKFIGQQIQAHRLRLRIPRKVAEFDQLERQERIDVVLRPVWESLSSAARDRDSLRLRFECIRKLGWRQGYSSGYPQSPKEDETGNVVSTAHLPQGLGKPGAAGLEAFKMLREQEDSAAWDAWKSMTAIQRVQEEKAAWRNRDRSQIYLDDSDSCRVLGGVAPRWYATPERVGQTTFLPNIVVRLVKNHTPDGQAYDPWKATFRVPLNVHKHALRSYLLAIYGLKTTWARSSIYRSPVSRSMTGKVISGKGRTWKKVEVGLLEPFLFPEVAPDFKTKNLLQSELDYERSRVYLKMTKTTRWRSKKSVAEYEAEIRNAEAKSYAGLAVTEAEAIHGATQTAGGDKPVARFIVKTTGLPSAKHGKILKLLAEKRAAKDKQVDELVAKYKADGTSSAASSS